MYVVSTCPLALAGKYLLSTFLYCNQLHFTETMQLTQVKGILDAVETLQVVTTYRSCTKPAMQLWNMFYQQPIITICDSFNHNIYYESSQNNCKITSVDYAQI